MEGEKSNSEKRKSKETTHFCLLLKRSNSLPLKSESESSKPEPGENNSNGARLSVTFVTPLKTNYFSQFPPVPLVRSIAFANSTSVPA